MTASRANLMVELIRLKLTLEGEIMRVNVLEQSTDVEDANAMFQLNTYRRSLADRYVQYGVQLAKLCDSYDTERTVHAARN